MVPLSDAAAAASHHGKLVHLWSAEEVQSWVANVEGGRFSSIVLPPHITGEHLVQLGSKRLTELFSTIEEGGKGRGQGEGLRGPLG